MTVISLEFAFFSSIVVFVYHILPWKFKQGWLFLTSFGFYSFIDLRFSLVLLILTGFNYFIAIIYSHFSDKNRILIIGVFTNISCFILLKWLSGPYAYLIVNNNFSWILPIGFSFYLLQLIRFLLDMKKTENHIPNFIEFGLSLVYFPKLLSGPIENTFSLITRFYNPILVTNEVISKALGLILNGVFRKIVIADLLQNAVFSGEIINGVPVWAQLLSFSIVLYNDFAGYSSIVCGLSLLFGIEITSNFQNPYLARNFSEFWSRWHISLTKWLRETVYFPISRTLARKISNFGVFANYLIPPLITMLISGFWHGMNLGMIVWGGLHAVLLIIERILYEKFPQIRPSNLGTFRNLIGRIVVFISVSVLWIPFMNNGLQPSIGMFNDLFNEISFGKVDSSLLFLLLIPISFFLDSISFRKNDDLWWLRLPLFQKSVWLTCVLLAIVLVNTFLTQSQVSTFIYQGF